MHNILPDFMNILHSEEVSKATDIFRTALVMNLRDINLLSKR